MINQVSSHRMKFAIRMKKALRLLLLMWFILGICIFAVTIAGAQEEQETPKTQEADSASWKIVIAPATEAGERMIISGTVFGPDGKTPRPGVEVMVYHTDAKGYYAKGSNSPRTARLKGTLITNAEGKYEFESIKPGPYPSGGIPAHVHYAIIRDSVVVQRFELLFEGDPFLTEDMKKRGTVEGGMVAVRKLEKDANGIWRGEYNLILKNDNH